MIGYRKRAFEKLHDGLMAIAQDPADIATLLGCERLLLAEILHAESQIDRYKRELKADRARLKTSRPSKVDAARLKRRIEWVSERIEAYRQLIYIWRWFGDGFAFSYLDKYAVKHAFYETETTAPKQSAGFISGKTGLASEIALVEKAAAAGVPSILVDLTNSLRHGDVCLLGASDPYLIEVKSSDRLNERGARQVGNISKLHTFYETDVGVGLRGYPELRREIPAIPERCYETDMNSCIERAPRDGWSVVNPEQGLYYAAIYGGKVGVSDVFKMMTVAAGRLFMLNPYKTGRSWSPYRPFTLSIKRRDHLYDFIRGELFLLVMLDVDVLCKRLEAQGFTAEFADESEVPLRYRTADGGVGGISGHFL